MNRNRNLKEWVLGLVPMRPLLLILLLSFSLALAGCSKPPAATSTTTSTPPGGSTTTSPSTNSTGGTTNGTTTTPLPPKDLCSDTKDFSTQQPDSGAPGSFVATTKACPGATAGYASITMTVDWSATTPAPAVAQNGVAVKLIDPSKGTVGSCGGPSAGPAMGPAKCTVSGTPMAGDYTLRYEGGGTLSAKVKVSLA